MAHKQTTLLAMPNFTRVQQLSQKKVKVTSQKGLEKEVSSGNLQQSNVENLNNSSTSTLSEADRIKIACSAWNDSWAVSFDWVYFDACKGRMFCKICECMKKCRSEFGTCGSVNIQLSAIRCHAQSRQHKWASYSKVYGKKALKDGIDRIRGNVDEGILNLFRCVYFIAKQDLAYLKYPALVELMDVCGYAPLSLYRNDKAATSFASFISESIFNNVLQKLKSSPFFGIMVDESTDISIIEHMIVYATYMYDNEPQTSFLGLLELNDRTAKGLENALLRLLETYGLDHAKMVNFGSDGASVMVGVRNGLASLLKKRSPYMIPIHCVAHRTHLCVSDAFQSNSVASSVDSLLNEIAGLFKKSSKRSARLVQLQEAFDCPPYKVEKIHKLRWLSRHKVLEKICEVLEPLLAFLLEENVGLFKRIANFKLIYILHFLADILEHLASLNVTFQKSFVDVTSIPTLLSTTIALMDMEFAGVDDFGMDLRGHDGYGFPIIPEYGVKHGWLWTLRSAMKGDMYYSQRIERCVIGADLADALHFQREFCAEVKYNLENRFGNASMTQNFGVLSPVLFPCSKELKNYGGAEIDALVKHFGHPHVSFDGINVGPLIDERSLRREFHVFKVQGISDWKGKTLRDAWCMIGKSECWREKYPNLLCLAQIAMLQCCSTAVCERGFSVQNIIKKKARNRLETLSLDVLMRISLEGPSLATFDFTEAINLWRDGAKTSRHVYGCIGESFLQ